MADGEDRGRGSNDPAPKTLGKKKPLVQKPEKGTPKKNKRKNKGTPAKVEAEELKPAKAEKEGIQNASSSSAAQKPEEGQEKPKVEDVEMPQLEQSQNKENRGDGDEEMGSLKKATQTSHPEAG